MKGYMGMMMEYTNADYKRMGYWDKADYEAKMRRAEPRYKCEMTKDDAPHKKTMKPDDYNQKGMDYQNKDSMEY